MNKLYTVESSEPIFGMDYIQGPLSTPTKMKFSDVLEMVRRGYTIYEVNPFDFREKVLVTTSNINNIKFKNSRSESTRRKKLNREIQEMNKPMKVDVVTKEVKEEKVEETNDTIPEITNKKKNNRNKLTTPDSFSK